MKYLDIWWGGRSQLKEGAIGERSAASGTLGYKQDGQIAQPITTKQFNLESDTIQSADDGSC